MEAATAVKIHIVNENDFVILKPLKPIAKHRKKPIINGPDSEIFPVKIITNEMMNRSIAQPKRII